MTPALQPTLNYHLSKKRKPQEPPTETEVFEAVGRREVDRVGKLVTKRARELGYRLPGNPWPRNTPNFTAPAYTAEERQWLGAKITFERWRSFRFTPLGDFTQGIQNSPGEKVTGHVTSLAYALKTLWVFVPEEGFYLLKIDMIINNGVHVEMFKAEQLDGEAPVEEPQGDRTGRHHAANLRFHNRFFSVYAYGGGGYYVIHNGTGKTLPHFDAYPDSKGSRVCLRYLKDAKAYAELCETRPGIAMLEEPTRGELRALVDVLKDKAEARRRPEESRA